MNGSNKKFIIATLLTLSSSVCAQSYQGILAVYTVKSGDEIMKISNKFYNTHQAWQKILDVNNGVTPANLQVGQELIIPKLTMDQLQDLPKEVRDRFKMDPLGQWEIVQATEKENKKLVDVKIEPNKKVDEINEHEKLAAEQRARQQEEKEEKLAAEQKKQQEKLASEKVKQLEIIKKKEEEQKRIAKQLEQEKKNQELINDENISLQNKLAQAIEQNASLLEQNRELIDKLKKLEERLETKNQIENTRSIASTEESEMAIKDLEQRFTEELQAVNDEKKALEEENLEYKRTLAKIEREGGSPRWLAKYRELQEKYFEIKEDYQKVKIQQNKFNRNEGMFALWEQERKDLENQVIELKDKLAKSTNQKEVLEEKLPYYMPTQMAYSQEQVLKERNRILSHRFWIEKNKNIGKCEVNFPDVMEQSKDQYQELLTFLNAQFGKEKVFIESQTNSIIAHIPGEAIYGVDDPKVRSTYDKKFKFINQYLEKLPIEEISITGFSKYDTVNSEKGYKVSGNYFIHKQSLVMRDYFVDELGISPALVESNSGGVDLTESPEKRFILKFDFKDVKQASRAPASVVETDKALQSIGQDILKELYEPKYSQINISNTGLNLDLGRHYFFKDDSTELTVEGKQKIDKIMKMFSLATDSQFHFTWYPGILEKNEDQNKRIALRQMNVIKSYIDDSYDWAKGKVTVGFKSRFNKQRMADNLSDDRYNRRISFSIKPVSISAQAAGEPIVR